MPAPAADTWISRLANDNQVAILLQFNSGLPFNARADSDLNQGAACRREARTAVQQPHA